MLGRVRKSHLRVVFTVLLSVIIVISGCFGIGDWTTKVEAAGTTWTSHAPTLLTSGLDLTAVEYHDGRWIALSINSAVTSTDQGVTWSPLNLPAMDYYDIQFTNGLWTIVGNYGRIFTSADAVNWTQQTVNASLALYGIASGNGTTVIVGDQGTLWTSTNGTTWTNRTGVAGNDFLYRVAYGNGQFVAVGGGGSIYSSPDGITWTKRDASGVDASESIFGVTYAKGVFVVSGTNSTIVTSPDGVNWTKRTSPVSGITLGAIAYGGGKFVMVGQMGTVLVSTDGLNWVQEGTSGITNEFADVAYGIGKFIAVGFGGISASQIYLSDNSQLSNLTISAGTLSPGFASGTTSYTASVAGGVSSINITPTVTDAGATVKVDGTAAVSGTAITVSLNVGSNAIPVVVTAENGVTTKTYTINVTRAAASNNANLSGLTLSAGTLSPVFASGTTSYTASVGHGVSSINVTQTVADSGATVTVNGTAAFSGTATTVSLNVGPNSIPVVVTAQDGSTKTYTITVTRSASNNADLSNLTLSSGTLSPVFTSGTTIYTASVGNGVSSVDVTPTVADSGATVTVNGTSAVSGTATTLSLNVGSNTITAVVTAADGSKKTYTITVTRSASNNADLSNLTLSVGTLSPVFASGTTSYTASVGHGVSSINVTPTVADAGATVTVNGAAVVSGTATTVPLNVGSNTITVLVTAQDGTTLKTYIITVTRTLSSNADLSNLTLSVGTLSPVFASGTTSYTASVDNSVTSIDVTPTLADAGSTVTVNGAAVVSGTATTASLVVGSNPITIVVTAADGVTTTTYTIDVSRGASDDAKIIDLVLREGTLTPAFDSNVISYTVHVANVTTAVYVTPTLSDLTSTLKLNGSTITSGDEVELALNVGSNIFKIEVTAQSGVTNTYTVTVNRADIVPANPNLSNLVISAGQLSPAFNPVVYSYSATAPYSVSQIHVIPTAADLLSVIEVNGTVISSGDMAMVSLNEGINNIIVRVTNNGLNNNYTITITRKNADQTGGGNEGSIGGGSGSSSSGSSSSSSGQNSHNTNNFLDLYMDNQLKENLATIKIDTVNGQQATTVLLDNNLISKMLLSTTDGKSIKIPVQNGSGLISVLLNGDLLTTIHSKQASLEITTEHGEYRIPAALLNLDEILSRFDGAEDALLQNVKVHIEINKVSQSSLNIGNHVNKLIAPAVDFGITLSYGNQNISIDRFQQFVQRSIPINEGIERGRVTTGVEIGKDGELLHIPTKVVQRDGKYFAVINSLHNSIYSVIENQAAFSDVTGHWAQSSIENLASRLIVNGNEEGKFQANRTISRAEFISILVRALGIHESDKTANFIDVSENDWYYDAVNIGVEYGLIQGYEKSEFRPDNQVTKQEAMVMLTKALKLAGKDVSISAEQIDIALSSLQDREQLASWAREAAAMNLQEEIVNGYQGKLAPRSNITRAETVKMIEQLLIKADLI